MNNSNNTPEKMANSLNVNKLTPARKTRKISLVSKGLASYQYKANDFLLFTIRRFDGQWEMEVAGTFREEIQGGEREYLGTYWFDTLREAKLFATVYNVRRHS